MASPQVGRKEKIGRGDIDRQCAGGYIEGKKKSTVLISGSIVGESEWEP